MEVPNESKALPPKSRRKPEKKTNETFSQIASWTLNEINPKYLKKWPRYGFEGLKEVGYVLGSVRHIVMVDVVSGIVNSCLLFTFCAVFSTGEFVFLGTPIENSHQTLQYVSYFWRHWLDQVRRYGYWMQFSVCVAHARGICVLG